MKFEHLKDNPRGVILDGHPMFRARLSHLVETDPLVVIGMYQQGTLLDHLRDVAQRAVWEQYRLMQAGTRQDEATELVLSQVVGDDAPPSEDQTKIRQAQAVASRLLKSLQSDDNPAVVGDQVTTTGSPPTTR
jgi:hypothetical protein